MPKLYEIFSEGKVDPSDVVTHILPLNEAQHGYEIFDTRQDNCIKVVLKPH
jgi:S-(hydroxymethyl)glutathione dehydrogenase/alcohol dehydrogenase